MLATSLRAYLEVSLVVIIAVQKQACWYGSENVALSSIWFRDVVGTVSDVRCCCLIWVGSSLSWRCLVRHMT